MKWINISCSCGYRTQIKNFDFIQPENPFFKAIYGNDPVQEQRQRQKSEAWEKENAKDRREIALRLKVKNRQLHTWEEQYIKQYIRESGLE